MVGAEVAVEWIAAALETLAAAAALPPVDLGSRQSCAAASSDHCSCRWVVGTQVGARCSSAGGAAWEGDWPEGGPHC